MKAHISAPIYCWFFLPDNKPTAKTMQHDMQYISCRVRIIFVEIKKWKRKKGDAKSKKIFEGKMFLQKANAKITSEMLAIMLKIALLTSESMIMSIINIASKTNGIKMHVQKVFADIRVGI